MFPKFDDVAISTYLRVLAKIRRPSMTPSASTPRSLSSRTMSAASLATSVAESTEMPTSAACRATASLTPSPRNATSTPVRRATLMMRDFWSGLTRAKTVVSRDRRRERVVVEPLDLGAGEDSVDGEADVAADLGGDGPVVAGDDLDGDAEPVELGDRRAGVRPWAGRRRSGSPPRCRSRSSVAARLGRDRCAARVATATTRAPSPKRRSSAACACGGRRRRSGRARLPARPW